MSYWVNMDLENKILEVLKQAKQNADDPCLDEHELAIELLRKYPHLLEGTPFRLHGSKNELFGRYLADQLSKQIHHHSLPVFMRKTGQNLRIYKAPDGTMFEGIATAKFFLP